MIQDQDKEKISLYLDGLLSEEENREIAVLLEQSKECRQYYEDMKMIREDMQKLPDLPVPEGMADQIMRRLKKKACAEKEKAPLFSMVFPRLALAAGIMLALICALHLALYDGHKEIQMTQKDKDTEDIYILPPVGLDASDAGQNTFPADIHYTMVGQDGSQRQEICRILEDFEVRSLRLETTEAGFQITAYLKTSLVPEMEKKLEQLKDVTLTRISPRLPVKAEETAEYNGGQEMAIAIDYQKQD